MGFQVVRKPPNIEDRGTARSPKFVRISLRSVFTRDLFNFSSSATTGLTSRVKRYPIRDHFPVGTVLHCKLLRIGRQALYVLLHDTLSDLFLAISLPTHEKNEITTIGNLTIVTGPFLVSHTVP